MYTDHATNSCQHSVHNKKRPASAGIYQLRVSPCAPELWRPSSIYRLANIYNITVPWVLCFFRAVINQLVNLFLGACHEISGTLDAWYSDVWCWLKGQFWRRRWQIYCAAGQLECWGHRRQALNKLAYLSPFRWLRKNQNPEIKRFWTAIPSMYIQLDNPQVKESKSRILTKSCALEICEGYGIIE